MITVDTANKCQCAGDDSPPNKFRKRQKKGKYKY